MITSSPKTIQVEFYKEEEEGNISLKPKNYTFQVPIGVTEYKAAPFDYQAINHAAMVGGLTRSNRIYDQTRKAPITNPLDQGRKNEKREEEKASLVRMTKASKYKVVEQSTKTVA